MNRTLVTRALIAAVALTFASAGFAGPREEQLATYATAAKADAPGFAGFSAARGKIFHTQKFAGGKPDTPACTSCHGIEPRSPGRNTSGKLIDAMALSATPSRYTDPAKVEKWFRRNCNDVHGRACTAQEKGDWLTFMMSQ